MSELDQWLGRCYGAAILNKETLSVVMGSLTTWLDEDPRNRAAASARRAQCLPLADRDFISKKHAEFLTSALGAQ